MDEVVAIGDQAPMQMACQLWVVIWLRVLANVVAADLAPPPTAAGVQDCLFEQRPHLQHAGHAMQQGVVQHIAADPQQARHQPVLAVGQSQVMHAGVMAMAAHLLPLPGREPVLAPHQLQAAAHGRLVHLQRSSSPALGFAQFQNIEDMQVVQGRGRPIGGAGPAGSGRRHRRDHQTAASFRDSTAPRGLTPAKHE